MRLSEFLEAWVQLVFAGEGNRVVPRRKFESVQDRLPQQGVTELKKHHKVAAPPRNLGSVGHLKRLTAGGSSDRYLELAARLC